MVFLDLSCINPIRHMSARWGFRIFACPVCYKHAAPLGLCWFISHWLIELINSAHIMEKVGTG